MLGAIIGDLAGSIYEFDQFKQTKPVKIKNIIEDNAFFSDDTILTIAIAEAITSNTSFEKKLREYGLKYNSYSPNFKPYFKFPFSPGFRSWIKKENDGNSNGNGAMMRISPVGFLFNSEEEVIKNARLSVIPSHNTPESIKHATTIALIIFYARQGMTKQAIINKLNLKFKKPNITQFNSTCEDTIDLCLYSIFNSNSFEESISLAISFGGDTDTNACIVGGMAEAFYGISDELKEQALKKLPQQFVEVLRKCGY